MPTFRFRGLLLLAPYSCEPRSSESNFSGDSEPEAEN